MVELVGHALLLSGVGLDVNNVANAVLDEECGELNVTVLCVADRQLSIFPLFHQNPTLEVPLEHVARTRAVTEGVRHLEDWKSLQRRARRWIGTFVRSASR